MKMQASDALVAMRIADGDLEEPPPVGPVAPPLQPLVPLQIPPPDWRAEEREQAERARDDEASAEASSSALAELEPPASLQSKPAPKQPRPRRTPNLDKVRAWRRL